MKQVLQRGVQIFTFPGALVCLMALIPSVIAFAPFWVPLVKPQMDPPALEDYLFFGAFGGLGLVFAAYLFCYRVMIGPESFSVGSFVKEKFRLSDIREVKLQAGERRREYLVYMDSGKRLRFSGLLSGFEVLTELLRRPPE